MSRFWRTLLALATLSALIAACGGGSGDDGGDGGSNTTQNDSGGGGSTGGESVTEKLFAGTAADNIDDPAQGKKGGKLTMLAGGDVDFMDPGQTYYTYAIGIMNAIHRQLFSYPPSNDLKPVPDIADGEAEISADGKTVTVKIKKGVMFSKPVDREVEAKDFKYAIERAFTKQVPNGYARAYLGALVGAPEKPGDYEEIEGIETPDKYTIVFKLTKGSGAALVGALGMPISVPVPQEYAEKFDKKTPSTYGTEGAVYTGPYMVESDAEGKPTGYVAGKTIKLTRNPDYEAVGDYRPAYLDEILIQAGNEDSAVAARRVLEGQNLAMGDIEPPARQLKTLLKTNKAQLSAVPGGGQRYISMDTSRPPFDDINVRKAVIAGFNRNAARQQRGGEALGPIAQHFIPPGMLGFEESGGVEGWTAEQDWMQKPEGDRALAAEYFKKAGMKSGKYEGDAEVLIVSDNADPDKSIGEITEQQLKEMGFKVKLRQVTRDTMYTKFCNVPKSDATVCPSVGWSKDFSDPQTMLDVTFNGTKILPSANSNWPELNVPEINDALEAAEVLTTPEERAKAYADINKLIVEQASVIPYMWDYQHTSISPNMRGVQNANSTIWDLNFTSVR